MKARKVAGAVLLAAGIGLLILSAIADIIGIGESPEFGAVQITGVITGIVIAAVGVILLRNGRKPDSSVSLQSGSEN